MKCGRQGFKNRDNRAEKGKETENDRTEKDKI